MLTVDVRKFVVPESGKLFERTYQKCIVVIYYVPCLHVYMFHDICFFCLENWFSVDEKEPIAFVKIEIIEGADMQPSDLNGLLFVLRVIFNLFGNSVRFSM